MLLVCLHGWGGSKESFTELRDALQGSDFDIVTPDLPGFGNEPEPKHPYTVDDYADWVIEHIQDKVQGKPWILLGHSHGGRISIKLTTEKLAAYSLPLPTHLILCASAGIKRPRHLKRIVGLVLAKGGRAILSLPLLNKLEPLGKKLLYKLVRVHDYEKASEIMRKTLINVSSEDLRPLLQHITVPTDIFWGEDDGMTPIGDAHIMKQEIAHATLHTFAGVRHRVHRDKAVDIAKRLRAISQE